MFDLVNPLFRFYRHEVNLSADILKSKMTFWKQRVIYLKMLINGHKSQDLKMYNILFGEVSTVDKIGSSK